MTDTQSPELSFDVPDDKDPFRCPDCGQPFVREELLALHRGQHHRETLGEAGMDAFESAYDAETDDLRLFRLKALLALIVLYFVLLMIYALV